jgi:predicted DNA-binding ribbon-helix-helix protein
MKPRIVRRSVIIDGRRTSISLENQFWEALEEIANDRYQTVPQLIASIDGRRRWHHGNLSPAIRLFILSFYRHESEITKQFRAKFLEQTLRIF